MNKSSGGMQKLANRRVSWVSIVIVIVAAVLIVAAGWFSFEIKAFFGLQPWARAKAAQAMDKFLTAVQNNDQETVRSMCNERQVAVIIEGDRITALRSGGPMVPPVPVERLAVAGPVSPSALQYNLKRGFVQAKIPGAQGGEVEIAMIREQGKWLALRLQHHAAAGAIEPAMAGGGGRPKSGENATAPKGDAAPAGKAEGRP